MRLLKFGLLLGIGIVLLPASIGRAQTKPLTRTPIEHFIVLMQQNHSFDNYFGTYPGADGLPPGTCIPETLNEGGEPAGGCVRPYPIGDSSIADLDHSNSTFHAQFNRGAMDGFVHALNQLGQDGRISMGYYDDRELPYYWNLADEYVLFDRFFSSAAGGSIWNRMYLVAGVPGNEDNRIPEGGFGDIPTIFDRLQEAGISWKFYVNNYDPTLNYRNLGSGGFLDPQVQWVPLLSFDRFIDDPALAQNIVPMEDYYRDLREGTLPAVSYMLALGATEHPLTGLEKGQLFVKNVLQALMQSSAWERSAFLLTYDDWGGWYDHVPPPQVDSFGYGFRVPALLVSPYARRGHVDSTTYDFTSILAFIERNWDLAHLSERDARANSLEPAFDFSAPPRPARIIPWERQLESETPAPRLWVLRMSYGLAAALGLALSTAALFRQAVPERPETPGEAEP